MNKSTLIAFISLLSFSRIATAGAPPSSDKLLAAGEKSYKVNCALCHGDTGKADGVAGKALVPKPRNFTTDAFKGKDGKGNFSKPTADQVFEVLSEGMKGTTMASFKHLPEEERWGLSYYVLKLRGAK